MELVVANLIYMKFQSTLLQEERPDKICFSADSVNFNPRSYKRSDSPASLLFRPVWQFQSTLLQEERPRARYIPFLHSNFNPRSYKRSDLSHLLNTMSHHNFNPRSYKRSDKGKFGRNPQTDNFNPRSYKRSDLPLPEWHLIGSYFNPRSYKRSDPSQSGLSCLDFLFQSTLLQEERHSKDYEKFDNQDFNPRSYKRSDEEARELEETIERISIHAPTRGATRKGHIKT